MNSKDGMSMKHPERKTVLKTILILVLLLPPILLMILFATGIKINHNLYTASYNDYYIVSFDYDEFPYFPVPFGDGPDQFTRIAFLPSQKEKLLNKIKEDVNAVLADIRTQAAYKSITIDYKISADFKDVAIYVDTHKTITDLNLWNRLNWEIGERVVLYHELLQSADVPNHVNVVRYVYTDPEAEKEYGITSWP